MENEHCFRVSTYVLVPEVEMYKRKRERKIERKHAFDQEIDQEKKRKNDNSQEKETILKGLPLEK